MHGGAFINLKYDGMECNLDLPKPRFTTANRGSSIQLLYTGLPTLQLGDSKPRGNHGTVAGEAKATAMGGGRNGIQCCPDNILSANRQCIFVVQPF